jgi:hypothetical protein
VSHAEGEIKDRHWSSAPATARQSILVVARINDQNDLAPAFVLRNLGRTW